MLAITHCDSADVIGKFGAASEYTLCASQLAPTLSYRDDVFGSAADFAATFEAEYGYAPPYQAAESAAAVLVFADAFERAGGFDKDAVRDALAATEMQTFYGNIRFDETGKNIVKPMVLTRSRTAPTSWSRRPGGPPRKSATRRRNGQSGERRSRPSPTPREVRDPWRRRSA